MLNKLYFSTLYLLLGGLWPFGPIQRPPSPAFIDASRVELATYYCVSKTDVLHAAAAHQDNGVFLKVVTFTRNISRDFHAVGEADTRYLSNSGVRFAGSLCRDAGADAALEGRWIEGGSVFERVEAARKRDGLRAPGPLLSPAPY